MSSWGTDVGQLIYLTMRQVDKYKYFNGKKAIPLVNQWADS